MASVLQLFRLFVKEHVCLSLNYRLDMGGHIFLGFFSVAFIFSVL